MRGPRRHIPWQPFKEPAMTPLFVRTSALLLAAAISAGNVAATQALAHHQVAVARRALLDGGAVHPPVSSNGSSVALLKALWR
jgi:hypothetical protein